MGTLDKPQFIAIKNIINDVDEIYELLTAYTIITESSLGSDEGVFGNFKSAIIKELDKISSSVFRILGDTSIESYEKHRGALHGNVDDNPKA